MDYHAVIPPEYRAGGGSNREDLRQQDSQKITLTATGASSSGQLEAAGASSSGRPVAAVKIRHQPVEGKFIINQTRMEFITSESSMRRARRSTTFTM